MHRILLLSFAAVAMAGVTAAEPLERDRRFFLDTITGFFAAKPKNEDDLVAAAHGLHASSYGVWENAKLLLANSASYRASASVVPPGPSKDIWKAAASSVTRMGDIARFHADNFLDHSQWVLDAYSRSTSPSNVMDDLRLVAETVKAAVDGLKDVTTQVLADLDTLKADPTSKDVTQDIDDTLEWVKMARYNYDSMVKEYKKFLEAAGLDE